MLVPKEMQSEHKGGIKAMSDAEIERAIELIQAMLAQREGKVIEAVAGPPALPAPPARRRRKAERLADRTLSEAQPDSDNAPVSMLAEPSTS
jgi:hypothetical protein